MNNNPSDNREDVNEKRQYFEIIDPSIINESLLSLYGRNKVIKGSIINGDLAIDGLKWTTLDLGMILTDKLEKNDEKPYVVSNNIESYVSSMIYDSKTSKFHPNKQANEYITLNHDDSIISTVSNAVILKVQGYEMNDGNISIEMYLPSIKKIEENKIRLKDAINDRIKYLEDCLYDITDYPDSINQHIDYNK